MNIDLIAKLKDTDAFMGAYRPGDETREYDGKSLLFYSLSNSDPESRYRISSFLLDKGADAAGVNGEDEGVLHMLLSRILREENNIGQVAELCRRLIAAGADVSQLDKNGRSCLQYLVMNNCFEEELLPLYDILLVEDSRLPFEKNAWGKSPVELAEIKGTRPEFVKRAGA